MSERAPVPTRLSHHLLTPMTRMRLRLEELLATDDLPDGVATGLALALGDLDDLAAVATAASRDLGDPVVGTA